MGNIANRNPNHKANSGLLSNFFSSRTQPPVPPSGKKCTHYTFYNCLTPAERWFDSK